MVSTHTSMEHTLQLEVESQDESNKQSVESQVTSQESTSGTIMATYPSYQSDPNNVRVTMLRVLFNQQRPDSAVQSEAPLTHHTSTPKAEHTSVDASEGTGSEVDKLRDALREAKIQLIQANNDRYRLKSTVQSLEKELANVYINVQSDLGIWERELLELRPLKKEVEALRDENKRVQAEKELLANERHELFGRLERSRMERGGDGSDLTDTRREVVSGKGSRQELVEGVVEPPSSSTPKDQSVTGPGSIHVSDLSGKIIKVPRSIYPDSVQLPREELMSGAENGLFRYDRSFLMQFMSTCKEDNPISAATHLGLSPNAPRPLPSPSKKSKRGRNKMDIRLSPYKLL